MELRIEEKQKEWRSCAGANGNRLGEPDTILCFPPLQFGEGPPDRLETGNVQSVIDGELDEFIEAYCVSQIGRGDQ